MAVVTATVENLERGEFGDRRERRKNRKEKKGGVLEVEFANVLKSTSPL
jgi:hypothetical protein